MQAKTVYGGAPVVLEAVMSCLENSGKRRDVVVSEQIDKVVMDALEACSVSEGFTLVPVPDVVEAVAEGVLSLSAVVVPASRNDGTPENYSWLDELVNEFDARLIVVSDAAPKHYVAVDLGATSGRVILSTFMDGKLEMETVHRFPTPLGNIDGKYCWNIDSIFEEILKGLKLVASKGVKIESIGVDTWGVDFVCMASDGTLCAMPRSYRDPYTVGIPEKFFERMSRSELYSRTGIQIMDINSVFQLYALSLEEQSVLPSTDKLLFMPDAISYLLTGKMVCEYTILSTSSLMNPETKEFDGEILSICGIDRSMFPEIVYPGTKIAVLSDSVSDRTGLGKVPVIAVAGHDTASAAAAVPAAGQGFAYLSSGTWSLLGIETSTPVINEQMFKLNFTNEGGAGGTTLLLKNITGMWLLEQCLARWRSEGRDYSYAEVARMASGCRRSSGLIDPDAPEFSAPTDMPAAIRAYCKAEGLSVPPDDASMIRLIYDSLAAKYASVLNDLQKVAPFEIKTLHIIGGGSQNELLNQMTADACGLTVVAGPSEATALGNVMIQAGLSRGEIAGIIETKRFVPNN